MEAWQPYSVATRNVSINSENKIHDDSVARRYGFSGGLVPGTTVYAHMTRPLVARWGLDWLERNTGELVLLKPAYDGEQLLVTVGDAPAAAGPRAVTVRIANGQQQELARLVTAPAPQPPPPEAQWQRPPAAPGERTPISWDAVRVGVPLRGFLWQPGPADQQFWCDGVRDDLPVYRTGPGAPVHPGLVLQAANQVLSRHYVLQPWIHAGSRIVTRAALRVGQPIEMRGIPLEKWERKGHQFFTVYVTMLQGGQPAVEVWHTAIFAVRPAQ
ncbi:MAG TPA: hypothetical protein VL359_19045 [bacterium]|nr:hypothetical protein [bacterium]